MQISATGDLGRATDSGKAAVESRHCAEIVALRSEDAREGKYLSELTKRVSKALHKMKNEGVVRTLTDTKSNLLWEFAT